MKKKQNILYIVIIILLLFADASAGQNNSIEDQPEFSMSPYSTQNYKQILSTENGLLYAYLVMLFNNNPHFLNVILDNYNNTPEIEDYKKNFRKYIKGLSGEYKVLAESLILLYESPSAFTRDRIVKIENDLEKHQIIAKFIFEENQYSLDYCILGRKSLITIEHPFLISNHNIYNIQPIIHYDEFYSSNSTFYHDLVYIDLNEVTNDAEISMNILNGQSTSEKYFVGARVNEDIEICIKKAFPSGGDVYTEIKRIFIVHEMTHKIINNRFDYYNRIVEEELAIASTIYDNPYLGLSVVYSYLNYHYVHSPHRIAGLKFLRFVADETEDTSYLYIPSKIRNLSADQLRLMAYRYFYKRMELVSGKNQNHSALRLNRN